MRRLTPRNLVGLAGGITAAAGVLVLTVEQPTELDFSPFLYVAAVALVVAAAAGAHHLVKRHRSRNSRRIIANLPTVGHDTEQAGHFQTADRRLLADAYDVFDEETN